MSSPMQRIATVSILALCSVATASAQDDAMGQLRNAIEGLLSVRQQALEITVDDGMAGIASGTFSKSLGGQLAENLSAKTDEALIAIRTIELVMALEECPQARRRPLAILLHSEMSLTEFRSRWESNLRSLLGWKDDAMKLLELYRKPAAEEGKPLHTALDRLHQEFESHVRESLRALEALREP